MARTAQSVLDAAAGPSTSAAARAKSKTPKKKSSASKRAGLHFPVGRIKRHLKNDAHNQRVGKDAAVTLAAVLEYLTAEILEYSGERCINRRKARIQPRDINLTILNDDELRPLLKDVIIPESGVLTQSLPKGGPKKK